MGQSLWWWSFPHLLLQRPDFAPIDTLWGRLSLASRFHMKYGGWELILSEALRVCESPISWMPKQTSWVFKADWVCFSFLAWLPDAFLCVADMVCFINESFQHANQSIIAPSSSLLKQCPGPSFSFRIFGETKFELISSRPNVNHKMKSIWKFNCKMFGANLMSEVRDLIIPAFSAHA